MLTRKDEGMSMEQELIDAIGQLRQKNGKPIIPIRLDDSFTSQNILDSMSLLDFVVFLENRHGIKIPGEDIVPENLGSVNAVAAYLRSRL
jgi:acyl carrier protein